MIKQYLKIPVTFMVVEKIFGRQVVSNNTKEKNQMLKRISLFLVALAAIMSFNTGSAFALGQCGGEVNSSSQLYSMWKSRGIVSQAGKVARSAGYRSADSSLKRWMSERVIVTRVQTSVTINNFGCGGRGVMGSVGKKRLGKGWKVAVALPSKYSKKDISLKSRKGYKKIRLRVKLVGQATCSNPGSATVTIVIYVKTSKVAKPKKKPKPGAGCPNTQTNTTNSGAACQSNTSSQTSDSKATCGDNAVNSCNNTTYQTTYQINANCSKVVVNSNGAETVTFYNSSGNQITEQQCSTDVDQQTCVNNGGSWNSETRVCTFEENSPPPPPVDHAPTVFCANPAHIYVGGNVPMFCSVKDDDGDSVTLNVKGDNVYLHTSGQVLSHELGCPDDGGICYRVTVWGDAVTPNGSPVAKITATASNSGGNATWEGNFPVRAQPSGGF